MPIDKAAIGAELPMSTMTVDRGRLLFFAKAIGETNPIFVDVKAAQSAGHRDVPVPPTFLFAVEMENPNPFAFLEPLGVDLRFVLHGEQSFVYHETAYPGDELVARPRITDIYSKKGGALDFIVRETAVSRHDGTAIADLTSVIVVRNLGGTS